VAVGIGLLAMKAVRASMSLEKDCLNQTYPLLNTNSP